MTTVISMCLYVALATMNGLDCTAVPTSPPPEIEQLAIRLTVYDTALCPEDGACLQGNGDGYFASMVPVHASWYGNMAACPRQIFGRTLSVLDMTLYCGDSFGYINGEPVETIRYDPDIGWYMHVDVFWPIANDGIPNWNAWHVSSWDWAAPQIVEINVE